jgi:hypothetical protein
LPLRWSHCGVWRTCARWAISHHVALPCLV